MALTPKQEKFVQGLFKGLSQRQAYKEAFDTSKMQDNTIDNEAYLLAKKHDITMRLQELTEQQAQKSQWTVERLINEFQELKKLSDREGQLHVSAKSLENVGKLLGMYKDKLEHSGSVGITIVDNVEDDIEDDIEE